MTSGKIVLNKYKNHYLGSDFFLCVYLSNKDVMKIKITESQLRRIVEKVQESDNINEAWYDDVADFVKSSYSSLKGKTKEIFKIKAI